MLGKVLKYDIKSCARYYLPMYLIFAVIILITKIYLTINPENGTVNTIFSGMILTSYFVCLIGMGLLTEIFLVIHFYKKCISSEGYLTFTLPVKTGTQLLSKCLNSAIWHILSYSGIFLSLFVFLSPKELSNSIHVVSTVFYSWTSIDWTGFTVFFCLSLIVNLFTSPLMFFASMAIGQMVTRHKILTSLLVYIGFYMVFSMISSFGSTFFFIGTEVIFQGNETASITILSAFSFLLTFVQAGLYYFLTYFFLDRKLNLM